MMEMGRAVARSAGDLLRALQATGGHGDTASRREDRNADAACGFSLLLFLAVLGVILRPVTTNGGPF